VPIGVNAGTLERDEIDRVVHKYPFFEAARSRLILPRNGFMAVTVCVG
jgi:hypothetical protein